MDAKKRQEVRAELVAQGYSWDYVDSWPPKVTLWTHRDLLNTEGQVSVKRGTELPNHPGHPDHLARKSRIGLLNWPPSDTCGCKACREAVAATQQADPVAKVEADPAHQKVASGVCSCGWKSTAPKATSRAQMLRIHRRKVREDAALIAA